MHRLRRHWHRRARHALGHSLRVRLPHLLAWLDAERPDIVALQETKTVDEYFPLGEIHAAGYQAVYSGQKTYNGVALLSRTTPHRSYARYCQSR